MSCLALSLMACTRTIPGITAPATATAADAPIAIVTAVRPSVTAALPSATAALVASPTTTAAVSPQLDPTATLALASATAILPSATQPQVASATPTETIIEIALVANDLPERPTTYKVRKGEYIFCLARRFDVDPGQLMALNGLMVNDVLRVGSVINIPGFGSYPGRRATMRHPDAYVVQPGDTLYTIACQYGDLDPQAILEANGLESAKAVDPGMRLRLPDAIEYADSEFGTGGAYQPAYAPYTYYQNYQPPQPAPYYSPYYYYYYRYWTPSDQPPYYDCQPPYTNCYPPNYDSDAYYPVNPNVTIVPLDPQP
jgi:LysM repeat protein